MGFCIFAQKHGATQPLGKLWTLIMRVEHLSPNWIVVAQQDPLYFQVVREIWYSLSLTCTSMTSSPFWVTIDILEIICSMWFPITYDGCKLDHLNVVGRARCDCEGDWQVKDCAKMDAICNEFDVNAFWTTWEQGTKFA
jgi:hypothetical protein